MISNDEYKYFFYYIYYSTFETTIPDMFQDDSCLNLKMRYGFACNIADPVGSKCYYQMGYKNITDHIDEALINLRVRPVVYD